MTFDSIDAFLAHLATLEAAVEAAQRKGETEAGKQLVRHAQAMIGAEDEKWAPLAAATVAEKERYGWTGRVSATDPLLRTGEYRLSFSFRVDERGLLWGTDDPIGPYMEWGTIKMPARPVVSLTMFRHGEAAAYLIAGYMLAAFAGRSEPSSVVSFAMAAE